MYVEDIMNALTLIYRKMVLFTYLANYKKNYDDDDDDQMKWKKNTHTHTDEERREREREKAKKSRNHSMLKLNREPVENQTMIPALGEITKCEIVKLLQFGL